MLPQLMAGLLVMTLAGPGAAPASTPPPAAPGTTPTPAPPNGVDLHAIAEALTSVKKVPAPNKCGESPGDQARRGLISVLGSVGGLLIPGAGMVAAAALPVAAILTDKVLTILDCREQQQAATATLQAVRGEKVGTEVSWKSETRPNVSGASKIMAKTALADGSLCLTITDIVIIDGEETVVPKKMCRKKGASAFVRVV